MAEIDVFIAGRSYRVACRDGEEDSLRKAAALVDAKSREALQGLGTLSEARQLLFASLLLALIAYRVSLTVILAHRKRQEMQDRERARGSEV